MTKLRWDKADAWERDPGRVLEVHDTGGVWCGTDAQPFETQQQRRRRQDAERQALYKRSEELRYKAVIKKYGMVRAIELGVPPAFIKSLREAKLRVQEKEQRAREKRERRIARLRARS
jgi:hypothetical protein